MSKDEVLKQLNCLYKHLDNDTDRGQVSRAIKTRKKELGMLTDEKQEINKEEFREICFIVNKRNELQKVRNSARHKAQRLSNIIKSKQNKVKRDKLERLADEKTNKYWKSCLEIQKIVDKSSFPTHVFKSKMNSAVNNLADACEGTMNYAKDQLSKDNYKLRVNHPKKHNKSKLSDLKIEMQKYIIQRETAVYNIYLHTKETTKRLRQLLKKNKIKQRYDGNGGVSYLVYDVNHIMTHTSADEIKKIAFDYSVERGLEQK